MKILYRSYETDVTTDINPIPYVYRIKLFNKLTIWKSKRFLDNAHGGVITFDKSPIKGATISISCYKEN